MLERIFRLAHTVSKSSGVEIPISLQTNAILLDQEWLELFYHYNVKIGVSIDGPRSIHDRYRLDFKGNGTHEIVEDKLRWLLESEYGKEVFQGCLCVLDIVHDGAELVDYFYKLGIPKLDILLPDHNYDDPPAGSFSRIIIDAYEKWREIDDPDFDIRYFRQLIQPLLGGEITLDSLGEGPVSIFVVETSGEIEGLDVFKICGDSFTKTGLNILDTSISDVSNIRLVKLGLDDKLSTPEVCRKCRNFSFCGGGYMPHRFRSGSFNNPTVYCEDMMQIVDHIRCDVHAELGIN